MFLNDGRTVGHEDSVGLSVCKVYIFSLIDMAYLHIDNLKFQYFAMKMYNFGIHFWPRVTLVTLMKYSNREDAD
jgi:hypothetical protein